MKIVLYIIVISVLLTGCSNEYAVEDELYSCLKREFSEQSIDLDKTLDTLEFLYLKEGIIKSNNPKDYRQYYQTNIDSGLFITLNNEYLENITKKIPLNQSLLDSCVLSKFGKSEFEQSKFGKISIMIDSLVKSSGQIASSTIANAHLKVLSEKDFEHPYYRASILLSLQFLYFDKYLIGD